MRMVEEQFDFEQAYNAINTLINNIRTAIQNNPTIPINQLSF
jgi:hypothetical protein